jgi:lipopolysaccharide/colanic/teichoic acid biosynthesis glycosyltransferase
MQTGLPHGVRQPPLHEPIFKRPFDVVVSAVGLLLALPVWLFFAAWIRLEDGVTVFFRQVRIGRYGKPFRVLKFRSMVIVPDLVEVQARRNDPRITRVGRVLRRTALDELPQLWNILVGEMSFVGPRAQPEKEIVRAGSVDQELCIREVPGFAMRQLVRPGLTGIAQLFARREVPHRQKFRYDLIYVKKILRTSSQGRSTISRLKGDLELLRFDAGLVLRSVWVALRGRWEV